MVLMQKKMNRSRIVSAGRTQGSGRTGKAVACPRCPEAGEHHVESIVCRKLGRRAEVQGKSCPVQSGKFASNPAIGDVNIKKITQEHLLN